MNVILTGEKQIGKSTALARFLETYSGTFSGFRTVFDTRSDPDNRHLLLCPLPECAGKPVTAVTWKNGLREVHTDVFDRCVPPLLQRKRADMFVMDELGKFEVGAEAMRNAVEAAFSGDVDVLAVVRLDASDWTGALKFRPDVTVLTVTTENREDIPRRLTELLQK